MFVCLFVLHIKKDFLHGLGKKAYCLCFDADVCCVAYEEVAHYPKPGLDLWGQVREEGQDSAVHVVKESRLQRWEVIGGSKLKYAKSLYEDDLASVVDSDLINNAEQLYVLLKKKE